MQGNTVKYKEMHGRHVRKTIRTILRIRSESLLVDTGFFYNIAAAFIASVIGADRRV